MKYYIGLCYSLLIYWFYLVYQNTLVAEFARSPFLSDIWLDRNKYYFIVMVIVLITILVVWSVLKKEYYRLPLLLTFLVFDDYAGILQRGKIAFIIIVATMLYDVYRGYKNHKLKHQ